MPLNTLEDSCNKLAETILITATKATAQHEVRQVTPKQSLRQAQFKFTLFKPLEKHVDWTCGPV